MDALPVLVLGGLAALLLGKKSTPPVGLNTQQDKILIENTTQTVVAKAAPEQVGACVKLVRPPSKATGIPEFAGAQIRANEAAAAANPGNTAAYQAAITAIQAKYAPMWTKFQEEESKIQYDEAAQFSAVLESYKSKGWTIHIVSVMSGRVHYACPPGVLPIELQAQIDSAVKQNECLLISAGSVPGGHAMVCKSFGPCGGPSGPPAEVVAELEKRGWTKKSVAPPPAKPSPTPETTTSGWSSQIQQILGQQGPSVFLCPPGKDPAKILQGWTPITTPIVKG